MSTTSAFSGVKVQARVNVRSTRAQTTIMANASGPKRVSDPSPMRPDCARDATRRDAALRHPRANIGARARLSCQYRGLLIRDRSRRRASRIGADIVPRVAVVFRGCVVSSPARSRLSTDSSASERIFSSQGTKAKGGQAGVGYRGSTESGSAPKT